MFINYSLYYIVFTLNSELNILSPTNNEISLIWVQLIYKNSLIKGKILKLVNCGYK